MFVHKISNYYYLVQVDSLSKLPGTDEGEFAMLVSDKYQHQGLGTELLKLLVQVGRDEQLSQITADILPDNQLMQRVCDQVGFKCDRHYHQDMVQALLLLH